MRGKKDLAAKVLHRSALLAVMERLPRRPQLVVVNHHRIGDPTATEFDATVFSATQEALADQIRLLSTDYDLVTPSDALAIIEGRAPLTDCAVLLTFDDGYRDNLELAAPALKAQGAEAIFFLATSFLDAPERIPEWDAIAWLVRRCVGRDIELTTPAPWRLAVTEENLHQAQLDVLARFRVAEIEMERFIAELEDCAGAKLSEAAGAAQLLMNWEDADRMRREGMTLGLHSHSHRMFSRLDEAEQSADLAACRTRFEKRLGAPPTFLAYPFGTPDSFNDLTKRAAREQGVRAAFSFYGDVNRPGEIDPYDVKRITLTSDKGLPRMRSAMAALAVTGRHLL